MKKYKITMFSRITLFVVATLFVISIFFPLWRIELNAPQYPEGMILYINANGLSGDVDIVNGLNHYIGMKVLSTDDFMEFDILPYILALFALFSITVMLFRTKRLLSTLFYSYIIFGVISIIDFYRWTRNYGSNLDPNSAIKMPGISFHPPIIGYKKMLNIDVYSIPDIGGILLLIIALLLFFIFIKEVVRSRKIKSLTMASLITLTLFSSSCKYSIEPEPIKINEDQCYYCKMIIADSKYGAEMVTNKGRKYKFDDISCLIRQKRENKQLKIAGYYVLDYSKNNLLISVEEALFLKSEKIMTPMAGNIIALSDKEYADSLVLLYNARLIEGSEMIKLIEGER